MLPDNIPVDAYAYKIIDAFQNMIHRKDPKVIKLLESFMRLHNELSIAPAQGEAITDELRKEIEKDRKKFAQEQDPNF